MEESATESSRSGLRSHPFRLCSHRPVFVAGTGIPLSADWLRVGVTTPIAVDGVRVKALGLEPDTLGILPSTLHWKDDNPNLEAGESYRQAAAVPASKTPVAFVDVVSHVKGEPAFQLQHTVPFVTAFFPVGRYELTLAATGDGVKPRHRTFSLSLDGSGRIEFWRLR